MQKRIFAPLVAGLFASAAIADEPQMVINRDAQYSQGTFSGGNWLGLFCEKSACALKNTHVAITSGSAEDVVGDRQALDVIHVHGNPLALFFATPLAPGKVTTWYTPSGDTLTSRQYTALQRLGRWEMPWGKQPLSLFWVKLPDDKGFRYYVGDGTRKQFLFSTDLAGQYGESKTPVIHWAGDLDHDGKIDLVLSIPDDSCGYDERLYLSSQAKDGQFLGKAAILSGIEEACGC